MKTQLENPQDYSRNNPIHMAIYSYNGVGKTTFAGNARDLREEFAKSGHGLRTVLLDCGDAGAVTLRHQDPKLLRIVRIRSINHYLDAINDLVNAADKIDLLIPDTVTGIQTMAIREVKGKKGTMNRFKWGLVSSKVIECLAETRNFPHDVIYLVQEKKHSDDDDSEEITSPSMSPSNKGYLSTCVDWVGWLSLDSEGRRTLDFRISTTLEAKDRASIFPKLIVNPNYKAIRQRIITTFSKEGAPNNG